MKQEIISQIIENIDEKYINEAIEYESKPKILRFNNWKKIISMAACFIIITLSATLLFKSGIFETKAQIVRLDDGKIIKFYETDYIDLFEEVPDWYMYDDLSDKEVKTLFSELPITAIGAFNTKNNNNLVGIEGKINSITFSISPHMQLVDMYDIGKEKISAVKAIPVVAGYCCFVNGANQKMIEYYAIFEFGENTFYLNTYLPNDNKKALLSARKDLANAIEAFIDNGELDLDKVKR